MFAFVRKIRLQVHEVLERASLIGVYVAKKSYFQTVSDNVYDTVFRVILPAILTFFQKMCDSGFQFRLVKYFEIHGGNVFCTARYFFFRFSLIILDAVPCVADGARLALALSAH